uniref:Transthyretin-like family protein n=1 Tax=Syphacia muris TaxID=451379 RepID=A0A0N5AFB4_9BILA
MLNVIIVGLISLIANTIAGQRPNDVPDCYTVQQKVEIEGKLICRNHPAAQVLVTLIDTANGHDEILSWTTTNINGEFRRLYGQKSNTTNFKPYVKITHKCNDQYADGFRVIKFEVPKSFIVRATCENYSTKPHNIGNIELALYYSQPNP